jgi:hypothetical protein
VNSLYCFSAFWASNIAWNGLTNFLGASITGAGTGFKAGCSILATGVSTFGGKGLIGSGLAVCYS